MSSTAAVVQTIGFVGLGSMGAPMAQRLLDSGYGVCAFDVRPESVAPFLAQGAVQAGSPRQVGDEAGIVFVCLPDNESFARVALGTDGIAGSRTARIVVNMGTTGSPASLRVAEGLASHSIVMIDAPVTGGVKGARAGTLAVMVSGPPAQATEIEPLLRCFGNVTVVSEKVGAAQTMKLANNLISLATFIVTGEAMVMGAKAGLDPEVMLRVLNAGTGRNTITEDKIPRVILTDRFDLGATVQTAAKDIILALEEAESLQVPMWVGSVVRQFFAFSLSQGEGPKDYSTMIQQIERWAGTRIPRTRAPGERGPQGSR